MEQKGTDHQLWQKAASFSARAHRHQLRKDGETPYASHPFRVAMTIRQVFEENRPEILAAALLHDVLEDCAVDYDELVQEFGVAVADLVVAMTKDMRLPYRQREEAYDRQLSEASWEARLIKLADVYDNMIDARTATRKTDTREKAHRVLELAGDDPRLSRAVAAVRDVLRV